MSDSSPFQVRTFARIDAIDAVAWDALADPDHPFCDHAFLAALEKSASVGVPRSGWLGHFVTLWQDAQLVAAAPTYLKTDSYGEFIFDWAWARGATEAGLAYYPKMVVAAPFTPATGCRLRLHPNVDAAVWRPRLLRALQDAAVAADASSVHMLFCSPAEQQAAACLGWAARRSFQFHWHNHVGWSDFDAWLGALRAPSRKQVKRERRLAHSHQLTCSMRRGAELSQDDCRALYAFYRHTTDEKGAMAYLQEAFFTELRGTLAPYTVAAMAHDGDEAVAGALYFTKGKHLYGRYWGSSRHYDALHFELCYYAPIQWCLTHGLVHFEAGAQGEHKVKRGLLPSPCYSAHWLQHAGLAQAVHQFVAREAEAVESEIAWYQQHSPYRAPTESP